MAPTFFGVPVKPGTRFQNILVSFFNKANNPVREFIFSAGTPQELHFASPDPGRALITGVVDDATTFENLDASGSRSCAAPASPAVLPRDQADIVAFLKLLD